MLYRDNDIDKIPNKESLRRTHRKDGFDMKIYDQGRTNFKIVSNYIDRCFGRSIGKNFDKVKKHIYEKMRHHISSRYDSNLIENLIPVMIGEGCKYILDSQNRIQINKEYNERMKMRKDHELINKLTIVDPTIENTYKIREGITDSDIEKLKIILIRNGSYDSDKFNHIINGGILSCSKYIEFIDSIKADGVKKNRWGYECIYDSREYVESCFVMNEENIVHVFDANSSEFMRYKKERMDKKHKERRDYKRQKDEYNESLLYIIEYNKKRKEEERNNIDRDRLGFDDNSFIGEGYHGQQRKKK
jgi:hypothetical protein